MSNKDVFVKMFDKKIDKSLVYDNIISKYGHKNSKFRYVLVPICFILLIVNVSIFKPNNKIIINNVYYMESLYEDRFDLNSSHSESELIMYEVQDIDNVNFYKNLYIPFDVNYFKIYKILSTNLQYIIYYKSDDNKNISILFSSDDDIKYKQSSLNQKSIINDIYVEILYDYEKYIAIFNYNDVYFNVEGNNISQDEFVDFIKNIVRGEE